MRAVVCLLPLVLMMGCASTNQLKSEPQSRMPASAEGANWLARVCRSTSDNSVKSIRYVEMVSTTATPEQLEALNSTLLFVKPESQVSDINMGPCTCDAVAIQSESKMYVNRTLYDLMPETDRGRLMNDMAMGVGVPSSQVKIWCETKLKISDK